MNKLIFCESKILKLKNTIRFEVTEKNKKTNMNILIEQIRSYIKSKGANPVGPIIQYTENYVLDAEEYGIDSAIILQCDKHINNVQLPYIFEEEIKIENALYCRYQGPAEKLGLGYDKINVEAFDKDIEVGDKCYSIFLNNDMIGSEMTVDIFMTKKQ